MAEDAGGDKVKIKTIKLSSDISDTDGSYRVLQVKNTTKYVPGQFIVKADVTTLCESDDWDVTVVPAK